MKRADFLKKGRLDAWFPNSYGIYIHVPFCLRRCRYCAFVSSVFPRVPAREYADAILAEFESRRAPYARRRLLTLYFGGGTPSILPDDAIEHIVSSIEASSGGMPEELTLEANPEHVDLTRARRWKNMGVTRISLGIQSFDDEMLAFLGRKHTAQQAFRAVEILQKAGFDEISIDLIYGGKPRAERLSLEKERLASPIPNVDGMDIDEAALEHWIKTLEIAHTLHPAHVSCYELTLEPHTPLWTEEKRGRVVVTDEETSIRMMQVIPEILRMSSYEVSNYCRDDFLSAHNVSCWAGTPYLGLGPGAHSLEVVDRDVQMGESASENFVARRRANTSNVRAYLAQNGFAPPEFVETLTPQIHLAERLICAARTRFLWDPAAMASSLNADVAPFTEAFARATQKGWLRQMGTLYQTTDDGIRLNNLLAQLLFDAA